MFEIQSNYEYDGKYYIEVNNTEFYTCNKYEYEEAIKNGYVEFNERNTWITFVG